MVLTHKGHLKWVGARSYPLEQAGLMLVGNLYEIYLHSAPPIGMPLTNHMDSLSCMLVTTPKGIYHARAHAGRYRTHTSHELPAGHVVTCI